MAILYIDGIDAAQALGAASGESVFKFHPGMPLSRDISNITLVAQTRDNATTIGGRTPEELAGDFAKIISKRNRSTVQHIYLIASEAGMRKHGELSLAQRFVNAMAAQGFDNLQVHAIVSPGVPAWGMGVEVVTNKSYSFNRDPVGHVNAFYYKDQYSCDVDRAIYAARDDMESTQHRIDAFGPQVSLTREAKGAKRAEEALIRQHRERYTKLITKRKNDSDYQKNKVDILSTGNYKEAMQQRRNTFTAHTDEPVMSAAVSYIIHYLSSQRRYPDFIHNDLQALRANPDWSVEEIITALQTHKDKRGETHYYTNILQPQEQILRQQDFSMLQPAEPARGATGDGAALQAHGLFGAGKPIAVLTLREKLERYKTQRETEWWGFHYNFLGVMAVAYFISDCLCKTDYFNSKHRETKKNATTKLLNAADVSEFTSHEMNALREGRLGKIVADHGGLDAVITALKPAVVEPLEDDDLLAEFAAPDFDPFAL